MLDFNKSHIYGRVFNLSMLGMQIVVMVAITNLLVHLLSFILADIEVNLYGQENVAVRIGIEHVKELEDDARKNLTHFVSIIGQSTEDMVSYVAASIYFQKLLKVYQVFLFTVVVFCLFWAMRAATLNENKPLVPNPGYQKKQQKLIESIEQSLDIQPIAIGHRTANHGKRLVLSVKDAIEFGKGNVDQVRYIANHEHYHRVSWDSLLVRMVRMIAVFNCVLMAFFYGFILNSGISVLLGIQLKVGNVLALALIGYVCYQFLFLNFSYFNRFKEHLADEYAWLKTQSLEAAESALSGLQENANKLHPSPKQRIQYLQQRQSALPLQLFLMLSVVWMLAFVIPTNLNLTPFAAAFFAAAPWLEFIFIVLNIPLVILIGYKKVPLASRWLSWLALVLMVTLTVLLSLKDYWLLNELSS